MPKVDMPYGVDPQLALMTRGLESEPWLLHLAIADRCDEIDRPALAVAWRWLAAGRMWPKAGLAKNRAVWYWFPMRIEYYPSTVKLPGLDNRVFFPTLQASFEFAAGWLAQPTIFPLLLVPPR